MFPSSDTRNRIGIAGYMGAGKSTCATLCAQATGRRVIDADAEAKLLMENDSSIKGDLSRAFGSAVLNSGAIDFGSLGRAAFVSASEMRKLNSIIHPPLLRRLHDLVFSRPGPSVLDAALIPLWHIEAWFDVCLWVQATSQVRSRRLQEKTGMPLEDIRQRMMVQEILVAEPSGKPWTVIPNDGTLDDLKSQIAGHSGV